MGLDVGNQPCLASHCWFSHRRTVTTGVVISYYAIRSTGRAKKDPSFLLLVACPTFVERAWKTSRIQTCGRYKPQSTPKHHQRMALPPPATVGRGAGQRFEESNRTRAVFPAYQTPLMRPHGPRKQGELGSYDTLSRRRKFNSLVQGNATQCYP